MISSERAGYWLAVLVIKPYQSLAPACTLVGAVVGGAVVLGFAWRSFRWAAGE